MPDSIRIEAQPFTPSPLPGAAPLRVLFAAGGTGGHIYPAIALAQTLRQAHPDAEILFVGGDRAEARKAPEAGFAFQSISVHGLAGKWTAAGMLKRLRAVGEVVSGLPLWQSLAAIRRFRPQVVVGTSGYVCGPVMLASWLSRLPVILLEQNEEIGKTSKLVSRFIKVAVVISAESGVYFRRQGIRTEVIGNPVRPAILSATREAGITTLALEHDRLTLSIIGGSLGSTPINAAASTALRTLAHEHWFRDGWQVVHLLGPGRTGGLPPEDARSLGIAYSAYPYMDNIQDLLAASDVIISRAGGTFLAEIAARGVPLILIPWSGAASDHQAHNARPFAESGAAVVLTDAQLSADTLLAALHDILPDTARRAGMAAACRRLGRPESAAALVKLIEELAPLAIEKR